MNGVWMTNVNDLWMIYEWLMTDVGVWMLCEWYMNDLWQNVGMVYKWCVNAVWMVYEWWMDGVWMSYEWWMNNVWIIYEWYMHEWCPNAVYMIYEQYTNDSGMKKLCSWNQFPHYNMLMHQSQGNYLRYENHRVGLE